MKRHHIVTAAASLILLASTPAFAGWSGHGTAYTPHGVYNGAHAGSCAGASCSHAGGVAGPYGGIATNTGTVTRTAPGQFSNSGTATGPNGRSVQHAGDTSCAGGTCSHTGNLTGPDGQTASTAGSVTRNAPGQYSSSGTITGSNGNTVSHAASTTCAGATCARSGTVTGADGGTVNHSGTATRVAPGVVTTGGGTYAGFSPGLRMT